MDNDEIHDLSKKLNRAEEGDQDTFRSKKGIIRITEDDELESLSK